MAGGWQVDQVAAKPSKAPQRSVLIRTRKSRIADNVGHQDRGQFLGLAYDANRLRRQGWASGWRAPECDWRSVGRHGSRRSGSGGGGEGRS